MSSRWKLNLRFRWARASVRLASTPEDRSSMAWPPPPPASSRSTSVEPMNPAPPVTITRTGSPRRRLGRWFGTVGFGASDARPRGTRTGIERGVGADDGVVGGDGTRPEDRPLADDGVDGLGFVGDDRAVVHHGPQQPRAATDGDARADHRAGDACACG